MKLWMLIENNACREDLLSEHGLSMYVEACGHKILFDMGQTDGFIRNAEKMGVDLTQVDMAVLSHGHYDHGGGLRAFLEVNKTAKVYMNEHAFGQFYHGPEKYIGLDQSLQGNDRLVMLGNRHTLAEGLKLYSCNDWTKPYPSHSYGLGVEENHMLLPDTFLHEQYLQIQENGKKILLSGCSHKGILNIEQWFEPDVLIGGFHFKMLDPYGPGREALRQAAQILRGFPTKYYTLHCTGAEQFAFLQERMEGNLQYLPGGSYLEL